VSSAYDVIIIGLGAMGAAAAYHLTRLGRLVLGLDRFHPPHELGSSHGKSRIIREAYFEHPLYVPLVQRAYELWTELEAASGRRLFHQTGGLMIGPPDGVLVQGAKRSATVHKLSHEILSSSALRRQFPAFNLPAETIAVREPRAGILFPELAVQTHLELAAHHGASLRFDEPALKWESTGTSVRAVTAKGSYTAERLLLTAGAWMVSLLPDLKPPLTVERQVLCWFQPLSSPEQFRSLPIFICEYAPHRFCYGFPDLGDGLKIAIHHQGQLTTADSVHRQATESDVARVRELLQTLLPEANGPLKSAAVCLYTNTPDEHFLVCPHPAHSNVIIASPCSGHGFKFSPAVGEISANYLTDRPPSFDLTPFHLNRFQPRRDVHSETAG
jgi:sarcosine oxidase